MLLARQSSLTVHLSIGARDCLYRYGVRQRQDDTLCSSGIMDDVMFADNGQEWATRKRRIFKVIQQAAAGFGYTNRPTRVKVRVRLVLWITSCIRIIARNRPREKMTYTRNDPPGNSTEPGRNLISTIAWFVQVWRTTATRRRCYRRRPAARRSSTVVRRQIGTGCVGAWRS